MADRAAAIRTLGLAAFADVKRPLRRISSSPASRNRSRPPLWRPCPAFDQPGVPALLLRGLAGAEPGAAGDGAVETLFSRPAWIVAFLDAVEQGKVNRGDVDPARIQVLQANADPQLRARAAKLFAATKLARRQDVVAAYQKALQLKGDTARGKAVFKKECSACHQLEGVGNQVGADLNAIRDQGTEAILLNILDPNREVKPQFLSYVLVTDAGRIITGMITAETANSLTIRRADGTTRRSCASTSTSCAAPGCRSCRRGWKSRSTCRRWRICWRT